MTLDKYLKEVKQRVDGATRGKWMSYPWSQPPVLSDDDDLKWLRLESLEAKSASIIGWLWCDKGEQEKHECNATFIAHARTDVPVLLEMVEYMNSEILCDCSLLKEPNDDCFPCEMRKKLNSLIPGGE